MRQSGDARARADAYKMAGAWRRSQHVHGNGASSNSASEWNNYQNMSEMETEEGPTDPVEETSPARSTSAAPTQAQTEVIGTPPHSSETAPVMTSSPVITSRDSEPDPVEGNREGDLRDMEGESDEMDEKFPIGNDVLVLQEIGITPGTMSPPPEASQDAKEGLGEVGLIVPTVERCETPTDSLPVDSPSQLRASLKRKQLSPPEENEATADWENAVKRHRSCTPERIPFSRLPGRMPYGLTPPPEEAASGAAGPGAEGPLDPLREEGLTDSPTAPSEEDRPSGPPRGDGPAEPTPVPGALDSPKEEEPVKLSKDDGSSENP